MSTSIIEESSEGCHWRFLALAPRFNFMSAFAMVFHEQRSVGRVSLHVECQGLQRMREAGTASAYAFRSKLASFFASALRATILAILTNIGALYAMATFYPDAPFDGSATIRAAEGSFWLSIVIVVVPLCFDDVLGLGVT